MQFSIHKTEGLPSNRQPLQTINHRRLVGRVKQIRANAEPELASGASVATSKSVIIKGTNSGVEAKAEGDIETILADTGRGEECKLDQVNDLPAPNRRDSPFNRLVSVKSTWPDGTELLTTGVVVAKNRVLTHSNHYGSDPFVSHQITVGRFLPEYINSSGFIVPNTFFGPVNATGISVYTERNTEIGLHMALLRVTTPDDTVVNLAGSITTVAQSVAAGVWSQLLLNSARLNDFDVGGVAAATTQKISTAPVQVGSTGLVSGWYTADFGGYGGLIFGGKRFRQPLLGSPVYSADGPGLSFRLIGIVAEELVYGPQCHVNVALFQTGLGDSAIERLEAVLP